MRESHLSPTLIASGERRTLLFCYDKNTKGIYSCLWEAFKIHCRQKELLCSRIEGHRLRPQPCRNRFDQFVVVRGFLANDTYNPLRTRLKYQSGVRVKST